jgi:hypothetical protein
VLLLRLYERLTPTDVVARFAWLFGPYAHVPERSAVWREEQERLAALQAEALEFLMDGHDGVDSLRRLAAAVEAPVALGFVLASPGSRTSSKMGCSAVPTTHGGASALPTSLLWHRIASEPGRRRTSRASCVPDASIKPRSQPCCSAGKRQPGTPSRRLATSSARRTGRTGASVIRMRASMLSARSASSSASARMPRHSMSPGRTPPTCQRPRWHEFWRPLPRALVTSLMQTACGLPRRTAL